MGFHIHVAEHPSDQYDSIQKSGLRVVDRLKKHMILRENTIIGHAVHVDSKEVAILSECKSWVTHQPRSNMNNGVGVAEVESMLRSGIKVCLGNDGFSNTMWEEMKTAYLVHKLWNLDPRRMSGMDIIEMAINNNAALASQYYEHPLGMIKEGAIADLIFVDYQPITPMTTGNLPWHILFGFNESMVTTTIIDGKVLMRNRKLTTLDENEIANKARELAAKTWQRYNAIVKS
jgi:cytosine/adenosine deaminase-related metal-dependent hydrolase